MCLRDSLRAAYITLLLLCVFTLNASFGQQGSLYLSVGYNQPWYTPTTIHIEQGELGNSYDMLRVKGNNKTNTPISFLHLSYRLGYFYDDYQLNGIEISFDPVNYAIKDNQNLKLQGIINNVPGITRTQLISKKNGSYYYLNGANLALLNVVRRFEIYKANTKDVRVDVLVKGGLGPAFPHFENCLPINPVDDPQINWGGWNAGGEVAGRVTGYRYFYFELAGKYDYASFNAMKVFDGTAKQDLHTYMVVASIGFTIPTTRYNPLFHKEHKIVTLLPLYQHKDLLGKKIENNTNSEKKLKEQAELDSLSVNGLLDIPEFQDILDRKYKKEHPDTLRKVPIDSINNSVIMTLDSAGKFVGVDSLKQDSVMKSLINDNPEHLSKKALKKKRKAEAKAKKAREQKERKEAKEAELRAKEGVNPDQPPAEQKPAEEKIPDATPPAEKTPGVTSPPEKTPEVKDTKATGEGVVAPEIKDADKKEPEQLSKKERKKKEKEEKEELRKKEREEREAKVKADEEQRARDREATDAAKKDEEAKAQQERDAKAANEKEAKAKEKEEKEAKKIAEEEQRAKDRDAKAAKENEEKAKAREEKEAKKRAEEEQKAKEKAERDSKKQAEEAKAQEEREAAAALDKENREKAKADKEAAKQAERDAKAKEKEEREARKKAEKEEREKAKEDKKAEENK